MNEELTGQPAEDMNDEDKIRIDDEVIETIIGMAVSEVPDISSAGTGLVDGIAGILGKKNLTKGVKAEIHGNSIKVDISVIVNYGCKIHTVAKEIQRKVRETLEGSTGMAVAEVNVHIVGLNLDKEQKKEDRSEETDKIV